MTERDNINLEEEKLNEEVQGSNEEINDDENLQEAQDELLKKLEEKEKECNEYLDLLRRTKAEFDNFRKRTQREKESLYSDGIADAVKEMLPVLDNLERAVSFNDAEKDSLYEGVQMVFKSFIDTLNKMGVEEVEAEGVEFNPDFHNAVMHVEDPNFGENSVAEVLQKGYKYKDKIIRYSMVKVAN